MAADTIKSAILVLWLAVSFGAFVRAGKLPDFRGPSPYVIFGLLLISLHYWVIGYSVSEPTTRSIIFAVMIWLASFMSISAFGPSAALSAVFRSLSLIVYPSTAYLLYLQVTGLGVGENGYFVGIFNNPNIMGGYIALILFPVAFQNLLNSGKWGWQFTGELLILVCVLFLLYSTASRGAALAAGASLIYLSLNLQILKPWMKVVIICVALAVALLMQEFFTKYADLAATSTREYLIILRLEAIAERPLFGWGLAADVNNSFNMFNIFPSLEKGNTILQFVEELGLIIGLPLFLSIVWACVRIASRLKNERSKVWLILLLIGSLVHSMVETWMLNFSSFLAIVFWVLFLFSGAYTASNRTVKKLRPLSIAKARG